MMLDVFQEDPDFAQHEAEYQAIRREILGEESGDEEEEESGSSSGEEEEEDGEEGGHAAGPSGVGGPISDQTQTDLINLRRTIYLTIMSALDFEEAGHKLLKMVGLLGSWQSSSPSLQWLGGSMPCWGERGCHAQAAGQCDGVAVVA